MKKDQLLVTVEHANKLSNLEAEQSIIGCILLENSSINIVLEILSIRDFYNEANRKIFRTIIDLSEKNQPIDLITLSSALKDKNMLDLIGGTSYLQSLIDNVTSAGNVPNHAIIVKEKAIFRKLYDTAKDIMHNCLEPGHDIDQLLDNIEHSIFEILEDKSRPSFFHIRDIIKDSIRSIENLYARKELITGVSTGFEKIDDLTSGFQKSDLIIVAGYPMMGKSTFALNIAKYVAIELQIPVAIFSLDNSKSELAFRMLVAEAKIDSQRLRMGFLDGSDWPKLTAAAGRLSEASIYIDDTAAMSILEIKAKSRLLKAQTEVGLIVVDYIQLMRSDNQEQEMSAISRSLKDLAKEIKIPIIALYQLNRKGKDCPNRRPQMADLRESGAIEQYADIITFIYRDEVYNKSDDNPDKGTAEIIIGKQRNGPTGTINLAFLEKYLSFENARDKNSP